MEAKNRKTVIISSLVWINIYSKGEKNSICKNSHYIVKSTKCPPPKKIKIKNLYKVCYNKIFIILFI